MSRFRVLTALAVALAVGACSDSQTPSAPSNGDESDAPVGPECGTRRRGKTGHRSGWRRPAWHGPGKAERDVSPAVVSCVHNRFHRACFDIRAGNPARRKRGCHRHEKRLQDPRSDQDQRRSRCVHQPHGAMVRRGRHPRHLSRPALQAVPWRPGLPPVAEWGLTPGLRRGPMSPEGSPPAARRSPRSRTGARASSCSPIAVRRLGSGGREAAGAGVAEKVKPGDPCGPRASDEAGDGLLSHHLASGSTIGAAGLNCRVRNGNGCGPCALVVSRKLMLWLWATGVGTPATADSMAID